MFGLSACCTTRPFLAATARGEVKLAATGGETAGGWFHREDREIKKKKGQNKASPKTWWYQILVGAATIFLDGGALRTCT